MKETYKKINDDIVEISITVPEKVVKNKRKKEAVQAELDHIPDRLAELQKQVEAVKEREIELLETLKVFD